MQLKESGMPLTIGIQSNFCPLHGRKADNFCFDWAFFCKVSGFLGRFNVRYNSHVTHLLLSYLLLPFFFFNNKFNLAPRSLVFFWRCQQEIWVRDKQEVNFRATKPSVESKIKQYLQVRSQLIKAG